MKNSDRSSNSKLVELSLGENEGELWTRFFGVYPLVLVGTLEEDGSPDIAPKHLAIPVSWQNWFGFVCTPRHRTYHNTKRTGVFTVSYPGSTQIVETSLAAAPRDEQESKPSLRAIKTIPATTVSGFIVADCPIYLECELDRVVDELGENSLLIGRVVAAHAQPAILRANDRDDNEIINEHPLLAYLYPGRFASVGSSQAFPFHSGFCR